MCCNNKTSAGLESADKLAFSWTQLLTTAPGTPAVNNATLRSVKTPGPFEINSTAHWTPECTNDKKAATEWSKRQLSCHLRNRNLNRHHKIHKKGLEDTKMHLYQLTLAFLPAFAPSHHRKSHTKNRKLAFPVKTLRANQYWLNICDRDGTFRTLLSVLLLNRSAAGLGHWLTLSALSRCWRGCSQAVLASFHSFTVVY